MTGRGTEISRPKPWHVCAVDRQAFQGWQRLLSVVPDNLDRACGNAAIGDPACHFLDAVPR